MFRPKFRLTFHQRLLLITVIPVLGFVGVGSIFLYRIYEEYSAVSSDLRTWDAVESNLGLLGTLFAELKAERDLALLTLVKDRAGGAIANWKTQQNATDRALAALTIEMDRLERENVRVFGDNVKAVRAPFARLASVRAEIAAARLDGPQILSGYSRFTFNSFLLSESFRQQMRHPATYNFYDGIYIARKMREQDALVASVFIAVNAGYPFGKDGIATVRKQYYALTEGENYMRRPYPHLRAVFDPILKTDDASVAYYDFLATIAAASEFKALPRFPGGRSLLEVQAQRLDSYQKLVDNGFAFARSELNALATEHKRHAEFLSLSIAATLLLTLGVTFTVVRRTRGRLAGISESIDESASDVRTATAQLSDTSEQLSTNASSYAAALEEIDTSLKGIAGVAQQNAQHVAKADDIASHAKKSVSNGVSAVNDLSTAMDSISRSGREITKIISKINDISFQTNILALNAAVEAARAGEAGAGFSVVADEVRRLAQMCASAASETTVLIEESAHNASLALNKSGQVTRVFKDISQNVGDVGEIVANLNQGFHRQSRDIDRVNGAVANQRHVAQSTAAMARQTATAAGAMEDEVGNLGQSVHSLNSLLGHETPGAKPAASAPTVRPEVFAHSAN